MSAKLCTTKLSWIKVILWIGFGKQLFLHYTFCSIQWIFPENIGIIEKMILRQSIIIIFFLYIFFKLQTKSLFRKLWRNIIHIILSFYAKCWIKKNGFNGETFYSLIYRLLKIYENLNCQLNLANNLIKWNIFRSIVFLQVD